MLLFSHPHRPAYVLRTPLGRSPSLQHPWRLAGTWQQHWLACFRNRGGPNDSLTPTRCSTGPGGALTPEQASVVAQAVQAAVVGSVGTLVEVVSYPKALGAVSKGGKCTLKGGKCMSCMYTQHAACLCR